MEHALEVPYPRMTSIVTGSDNLFSLFFLSVYMKDIVYTHVIPQINMFIPDRDHTQIFGS
jgi:hypothetical protein